MKKKKIALSVLVVLLLFLTYGLGYWTGFSHARKGPRVIVAMDTADTQQSSGKSEYEPYFTKQNPITEKGEMTRPGHPSGVWDDLSGYGFYKQATP